MGGGGTGTRLLYKNTLDGAGTGDKWWNSGYPVKTDFTKLGGLDVGCDRKPLSL